MTIAKSIGGKLLHCLETQRVGCERICIPHDKCSIITKRSKNSVSGSPLTCREIEGTLSMMLKYDTKQTQIQEMGIQLSIHYDPGHGYRNLRELP
ncbi:PREDICTED: uncharacterized protein LOC104611941 [Nelumbo nucifera]|uniref:Uncharacterized protein LOC104611941 n=1 Tax=Nelumbo nucifera TaxID=4432 RepID=A0A1U8B8U3_NELNU|nr:PREDICTED: uncharacterized protein LOC104611941 [Nelumbo nucifera]